MAQAPTRRRPWEHEVNASETISMLLAIVIAGVGWWVNNLWAMLRSQQDQITQLSIKLSENYVPRVELQESFKRIFEKLDEIQRSLK